MSGTPKNPNVERVSSIPFEKDAVSPMPQYVSRRRAAGAGDPAATPPQPAPPARPGEREEYPGPQTSSTGERVEPGRRPASEADPTTSEEE